MAPRLAVMAVPRVGWRLPSRLPPLVAAAAAAGPWAAVQGRQIYAWLPQEAVCTENLAAWRRLLPCQHHAGLAALLQPVQLAAAGYASMGLELWVEAAADGTAGDSLAQGAAVRLRQVLTAVVPRPLPPPAAAGGQQVLLQAAFGAVLPAACAAASVSRLYAALPDGESGKGAAPAGRCTLEQARAGHLLACTAAEAANILQAGLLQAPAALAGEAEPALHAVQHAVQHSTRDGTLVVGLRVTMPAAAAAGASEQAGNDCAMISSSGGGVCSGALLHILQLLPWQLPVQASSLRVELDGRVSRQ